MSIVDRSKGRWGLGHFGGRRRGPRQRPRQPLGLELLEIRLVPATSMWLGTAGANWSLEGNWDTPPTTGSDLVFPSGKPNLTNTDDLGAMTFGTLTVAGSGYTIDGDSASFTAIDASQASGSSTVGLPIDLSGGVTVDNAGATLVLGGVISGSTGLTKDGGGTLDLTGDNTYTGTTTIDTGTLLVDGVQSGSPITADSATTLGGIGTVGTITATGATVSPGDAAPGILVDAGDLDLGTDASSNDSTYSVELDGSTAGNGSGNYSQTQVAGAINLTGATLNVTLGPDFTASVPSSFTIIDNTGSSAVTGTFTGLAEGSTIEVDGNTFQISYAGGANNNSVVLNEVYPSTTTLTTFPTSPASGQSVTLTATVTGPVGDPTPTGTVEFFNGATSLGSGTLTDGVATLATTTLATGGNTITADYATDGTYSSSDSAPVTVTVAATANTTTTVTFSPDSPVYGQDVTLTATVAPTTSGTPTGTVQFFNGTTLLGTGDLSGGIATFDATTLALGDNSITAVYSGDDTFTSSTSTAVTVDVQLANSSTVLTYSPISPVSGQDVDFTATVTAASPGSGTPTGTVEFFNGSTSIGTANLTNGVATLPPNSTLAIGANSITAEYLGDNNFNVSTSPAVTVTLAATATSTTTVSYSPSLPVYGDEVTLSATVAPVSPLTATPTGTVEFYNGTTLLGTATLTDGVGSLAPLVLPNGPNSITAQYSGDDTFTSSTSPVTTVTVAKLSTTTAVTFTPSSPVYGQDVTLTATLTPSAVGPAEPTGTVTFYYGSTVLGTGTLAGGQATFGTDVLPAGSNTVTAQYGGDTNYSSSTSPAITVPVTVASTTTAVTFFPTYPVTSQNVTLTATISPVGPGAGTPTGTVQFYNGATPLGNPVTLAEGVASLTTADLATGDNSITADYSGDSNFDASTSPAVTVTLVATPTSTTTVTAAPTSMAYGQTVTLTATVAAIGTGTPTGTVNFYNGTTLLGSDALSAGVGNLTTTLPGGDNSITAQYSGDSTFTSSTSSPVTVTVTQLSTTTSVTFTPSSPTVGTTVTFTATITPSTTGPASPTGTVDFFNGSTMIGTGTVSSGQATFSTSTLPAGTSSITAQYLGDTNYAGSTSPAVSVTVTEFISVTYLPTLPVYGQSVTLTAALTPTGTTAPTGTVEFFNGSTLLGTVAVANDGATLNTTVLAVGNNAVTAVYSGDSNYPASTSAVESVAVVLASTTTTVSVSDSNPAPAETVTITAAVAPVSPGAGTPTGTVEFFNNGTPLGTAAVSAGQASLAVVLPIGSNAITAQYSGDSHFESSTATALTVVTGTANEIWLDQVYLIELGRAPTTSDYSYWDTQFADGRSLKEIVSAIAATPEAKLYSIQSAFQQYLGQQGTPAQVQSVVAHAHGSQYKVRAAILGSPEFYAASGSTLKGFLAAAEIAVLGTTVHQPVLLSQLREGVSRTKVAQELLQSKGGKQVLLVSNFQTIMDRAPTNQEIVAYVGLMNKGTTLQDIIATLLAGSEFYTRVTAAASS